MALLSVLFTFSSCSEDEKTYELFGVSIDTYATINTDVATYVETRCDEFNKNELSTAIEQSVAEQRFNSFCGNLVKEVKDKRFKVFPGAWVKLQLSNMMQDVIAEKQVDFTQTATPKNYVQIVFKEESPAGNTEKATQIIEENLQPFAMTKTTETTEKGYIINTYSYYKEYTSYQEAKNYYDAKVESLGTLLDKIVDEKFPSDLIYTGRLELFYSCVNEATASNIGSNKSYIVHKPAIYKDKWVTTDATMPFESIVFSAIESDWGMPFFIKYAFTMDGQSSGYSAFQMGANIVVLDENSEAKYRFQIDDVDHLRVDRINGEDVENGAVFERKAL